MLRTATDEGCQGLKILSEAGEVIFSVIDCARRKFGPAWGESIDAAPYCCAMFGVDDSAPRPYQDLLMELGSSLWP